MGKMAYISGKKLKKKPAVKKIELVNKDTLSQEIISVLNDLQGAKSVEFVTAISAHLYDKYEKKIASKMISEVKSCLEKLIFDGDIMELEYVLPKMKYRLKSFYFPARTQLEVKFSRPKISEENTYVYNENNE